MDNTQRIIHKTLVDWQMTTQLADLHIQIY